MVCRYYFGAISGLLLALLDDRGAVRDVRCAHLAFVCGHTLLLVTLFVRWDCACPWLGKDEPPFSVRELGDVGCYRNVINFSTSNNIPISCNKSGKPATIAT